MEPIAVEIFTWLEKAVEAQECVELKVTVKEQIDRLDKSGNGIGLIFVLSPSFTEKDGEETKLDIPDVRFDVTSYPVVKVKNNWHIVHKDGLSDVVSGVVRLFAHI